MSIFIVVGIRFGLYESTNLETVAVDHAKNLMKTYDHLYLAFRKGLRKYEGLVTLAR